MKLSNPHTYEDIELTEESYESGLLYVFRELSRDEVDLSLSGESDSDGNTLD